MSRYQKDLSWPHFFKIAISAFSNPLSLLACCFEFFLSIYFCICLSTAPAPETCFPSSLNITYAQKAGAMFCSIFYLQHLAPSRHSINKYLMNECFLFIYFYSLSLLPFYPRIPLSNQGTEKVEISQHLPYSSKEQLSTKTSNLIETNTSRISVKPAVVHLELTVPYRARIECILTQWLWHSWNLPTLHGSQKYSPRVPPKEKSTTVSSYHLKTRLI